MQLMFPFCFMNLSSIYTLDTSDSRVLEEFLKKKLIFQLYIDLNQSLCLAMVLSVFLSIVL